MGRSDYLFPDSAFLEGMGSAFDMFGSLAQYNSSGSSEEADVRALRSDWTIAGDDLWRAFLQIIELTDDKLAGTSAAL